MQNFLRGNKVHHGRCASGKLTIFESHILHDTVCPTNSAYAIFFKCSVEYAALPKTLGNRVMGDSRIDGKYNSGGSYRFVFYTHLYSIVLDVKVTGGSSEVC